jgi:hypothetical protein
MKTVTRAIAVCSISCALLVAPALAAGPIDGEVSAVWWANELTQNDPTTEVSDDAAAPGLRAELWMFERYGLRASQFGSDPEDTDGADYTSVDVLWRALSPTENNFVAVGVGWQQMDVLGLDDRTSGARVTVEGRVGLAGMLYGYGHGSYLPSLSDVQPSDPALEPFRDLDSYEYELGVAWNALPFMNVHAGYRVQNLSFTYGSATTLSSPPAGPQIESPGSSGLTGLDEGDTGTPCPGCAPNALAGDQGELESAGFFAGVGIRF